MQLKSKALKDLHRHGLLNEAFKVKHMYVHILVIGNPSAQVKNATATCDVNIKQRRLSSALY